LPGSSSAGNTGTQGRWLGIAGLLSEAEGGRNEKTAFNTNMNMNIPTEALLNDFAIRSFSDMADRDYIAARMACRAQLAEHFLWSSQQAIEKYLKCILLLNRIPAKKVGHDLAASLAAIKGSGKLTLDLLAVTETFIEHLDQFAMTRYLERSNVAFGADLITLDRAVWQLRRFCTLAPEPRRIRLRDGFPAPIVRLEGHHLERIIDAPRDPARGPLLWQNAFFGSRRRRTVRLHKWFKASNSPLFLNPQILNEVLKYVFLPDKLADAYRAHKKP
jgi:HEPN domain-containing protein